MSNNQKIKGVSRIDSGSTHGWFVRGYKGGKTFSKLFSDKKYGSKEEAFSFAIKYRDKLQDKLSNMPDKPRKRRIVYYDSRNCTGVLGVCKTTKKSSTGKSTECYSVSWRPKTGEQRCTSFSINKYGEKKAFKMAVSHRNNMLSKIHSKSILKKLKNTDPSTRMKKGPLLPQN